MSHSIQRRKGLSMPMLVGVVPLLAGAAAGLLWFARRSSSVRKVRSRRDPARLIKAIAGNDKAAVVAVFGTPRASAGFDAVAPAMIVDSDYNYADIWYYPLDVTKRTALVVHFDKGIASDVRLVSIPPQ